VDLGLLIRRPRALRGGLPLWEPEGDAEALPDRALTPPQTLCVALAQGLEVPATPTVTGGEPVSVGEVIGRGPEGCVHAPASGTVARVCTVATPYALSTTAIEIEVDPVEPPAASGAPADAHGESDGSIEHLGEMGVGVSALRELAATATGCTGGTLIVNGLDTEPYRTENTKALVDEAARVIVAASNLHRTLGLRRIYLVSDAARRALTGRLRAAARGTPVRVVALQNRYPQGAAPLLVKAILKREIPIGCRPADLGAAVVEAGLLLDAHSAADRRKPVTHVRMVIAGAVERPGHYRVPLGVSVGHLAGEVGARAGQVSAVVDSMLSGPMIEEMEAVITRRTVALLFVWRASGRALPIACIRCGWCQDACPVRLDPRGLLDAAERGALAATRRLYPGACIACGLCDHVCPSALPLMRGVLLCQVYDTENGAGLDDHPASPG
jgi:electron transport complex protein RnfC